MKTELPRKKRHRRWTICVVLVLVAVYIGVGVNWRRTLIAKYDSGVELLQIGDYEAAYRIFSSMPGWSIGGRDADAMATVTKYHLDQNEAVARMESGDYIEALRLLMELDYNDPDIARLINECCRAIADDPLETVEATD